MWGETEREMPVLRNRREVLASLSWAAAAGLLEAPNASAEEAPLETTRIRLYDWSGVCIAPQFVAEELLKRESFTDVHYVRDEPSGSLPNSLLASGGIDINIQFSAPSILRVEAGDPVVFLGGLHVGCFELFGTEQVRAVRDLKGRRVAIPALGSPHHVFLASMAAYVGLDPTRDIDFATYPANQSIELLANRRIDALLTFPPFPQELRARKIGHVILNSSVDRPWSQYFCCMISGNREFVRKNPVATKRAMRALLKAVDLCVAAPERAARIVADRGYPYEYALQAMREIPYPKWRAYDPEDAVRFYSLRLRDAGMIKSSPNKVLADGTDWRFWNELKRELKG
jgi:NitT/TauT family transport system substrate-binding protein